MSDTRAKVDLFRHPSFQKIRTALSTAPGFDEIKVTSVEQGNRARRRIDSWLNDARSAAAEMEELVHDQMETLEKDPGLEFDSLAILKCLRETSRLAWKASTMADILAVNFVDVARLARENKATATSQQDIAIPIPASEDQSEQGL